ncbi:alpha/beta fold hydrolase [Isosphaeraceae bacterium EP7]
MTTVTNPTTIPTATRAGDASPYDVFVRDHPGRDFETRPGGPRMHYLDEGSGEPVVMVHGNPSWSFYYRNLAESLAGSRRVIVPDHVGCGRSDKPDDSKYEYTLSRRIDDLEALLEHLGVTRDVTLIVHDWGGMIGMGYAARHPDRIKRLVILNTAAFGLPKSKRFPWQLWFSRNSPLSAFLVRGLNLFARGAASQGCTHHPMPADLRAAYIRPYDSWANRRAVHRFVQDIPLKPGERAYDTVAATEAALPKFSQTPMLIAWGLRDFVFDRHFLDEWTRRFPAAEVHRFEQAGHYILEDEADAVIPLIGRFLDDHPIESPTTPSPAEGDPR